MEGNRTKQYIKKHFTKWPTRIDSHIQDSTQRSPTVMWRWQKPLTQISMQIKRTPYGTITLSPRRMLMQLHRQNKADKINRASCEWVLQFGPKHNHLRDFAWSHDIAFIFPLASTSRLIPGVLLFRRVAGRWFTWTAWQLSNKHKRLCASLAASADLLMIAA